jgi:hypothetical protein
VVGQNDGHLDFFRVAICYLSGVLGKSKTCQSEDLKALLDDK